MQLLQYWLVDGMIAGIWTAQEETMLQAQVVEDDPLYGYLMQAEDLPAGEIGQRWYVLDGELVAKTVATLTATPNPFVANGVAECTVTLAPFVPCTLLVNGTPSVLTVADPTLILTSDTPRQFAIGLQAMPTHWAHALLVEAT